MPQVKWIGVVHQHDLYVVHLHVVLGPWTSDLVGNVLRCLFELSNGKEFVAESKHAIVSYQR